MFTGKEYFCCEIALHIFLLNFLYYLQLETIMLNVKENCAAYLMNFFFFKNEKKNLMVHVELQFLSHSHVDPENNDISFTLDISESKRAHPHITSCSRG